MDSEGNVAERALDDGLIGGINVADVFTAMDGRALDVESTLDVCSARYRPN